MHFIVSHFSAFRSIFYKRQFNLLLLLMILPAIAASQQPAIYPLTTVSAASYEPNVPVAPGSIVAAFGQNLATMTLAASDTNPATPIVDLPTTLGGTTVQVNNIYCGILFVSPAQVNFVMPEGLPDGSYSVSITYTNNNSPSQGTVNVARVQPTLFAMNGDSQGVLAANVVRVKADGSQAYESLAQYDETSKRWLPKPIDLGTAAEHVFLEIYLTGIRQAQDENSDGNVNEHIFVLLGGKSITPPYAGKHGFFAGVDQVNVELPRNLIGAGKINLAIHGNVTAPLRLGPGFTSNSVELEIGAAKSATPPTINNISVSTANIGDLVIINGTGYGNGLLENVVTFGGIKGDVEFANNTQLAARVPFGAKTGKVKVVNAQGEAVSPTSVQFRTSLSGIIESTLPESVIPFPLQNIRVKIAGTTISAYTNQAGRFILNDVPSGAVTVEIDPSTFALSSYFPATSLNTLIEAGRDNALPAPILLSTSGLKNIVPGTDWNAVTGVLTESDGVTAVPNAWLRLFDSSSQTHLTTITDNTGSYVFRNVGNNVSILTIIAEVVRANGAVIQTVSTTNFNTPQGKSNIVGVLNLKLPSSPSNRPPVIIAPATANLKASETLDVPVYIADSDANDSLQTSVSGIQNATLVAGTNGAYTLRLNPTTFGIFPVEIKATDLQGNQRTATITVTVSSPNTAPSLTIPPAQTIAAGMSLNFKVSATDSDAGQTIQLSVSGLPAGATFTGGIFNWSPTINQIGTYLVNFTATDNGVPQQSTTKSLTITITGTPPIGSWTIISASLPNTISALAVEGNDVYAGVYANGVYLTTDYGVTWQARNIGLSGTYLRSLAVSGGALIAAIDEYPLFRSTDKGLTWAKTTLPAAQQGTRVTVDKGVFFTYNISASDAYYSTDNGVTWTAMGVKKFVSDERGIHFAQGVDDKIYKISVSGNSVIKTLTNFFPGNMPQAVTAIGNKYFAANPQVNPDINATYVSNDGGINWENIGTFPSANYLSLRSIGNRLYASTNQGALLSTDGGISWQKTDFYVTTANANYLFAAGSSLYVMPYQATNSVAFNGTVMRLPIDVPVTTFLEVTGQMFVGTTGKGLLRSTDRGKTWVEMNNGISFTASKSIQKIFQGTNLFVGTQGEIDFSAPFAARGGLFESPNFGSNWSFVWQQPGRGVITNFDAMANFAGTFIYSYTASQYGTNINMGGRTFFTNFSPANALLETNGQLLIGLASTYFFVDPDQRFGGRTSMLKIQSKTATTLSPIFYMGVESVYDLAKRGNEIFAVDGGLTFSMNDGVSWNAIALDELSDKSARSVIRIGEKLIVNCSKGILMSPATQKPWQLMPLNLNNQAIKKLFTNDTDLFCLTVDGSLYQVSGI